VGFSRHLWLYQASATSALVNSRYSPIVFVQTQFLDYWVENSPHAVVLVGIDEEHVVYLNDPAFEIAPQIASIDGFLAAWIEMDEVAATILC
jgi:hypothetical protein